MGKFPFTILALLFLAATLIAVALFLPKKASVSVDVNGIDAKVPLVPLSSENLKMRKLEWLGKEQPFYLELTSLSLSTEWSDFAFSFTPDKDGEISIILKGLRSADNDESLVAAYNCVRVNGAVSESAEFKLLTDTPKLSDMDGGIPADKPEPSVLLAAAGTSYKASISVRNGIPVTVKFSAKIVNKYRPPTKNK